jgi:hypothetical protein
MSHQKDQVTALLEVVEFVAYSSSPFLPAKGQHFSHMDAMPWQKHISSKHTLILKNRLQLGQVAPTPIQPMHQQNANNWLV